MIVYIIVDGVSSYSWPGVCSGALYCFLVFHLTHGPVWAQERCLVSWCFILLMARCGLRSVVLFPGRVSFEAT